MSFDMHAELKPIGWSAKALGIPMIEAFAQFIEYLVEEMRKDGWPEAFIEEMVSDVCDEMMRREGHAE